MISGYYSGNGNMSNFQRGGLRGSNQSMRSVRSRRDVDELAFASLGIPSNTGTLTSGYNSQVPYQDTPAYPVDQGQFIRQQQVRPGAGHGGGDGGDCSNIAGSDDVGPSSLQRPAVRRGGEDLPPAPGQHGD